MERVLRREMMEKALWVALEFELVTYVASCFESTNALRFSGTFQAIRQL